MTKQMGCSMNNKCRFIGAFFLMSFSIIAKANAVWPSIYIMFGMLSLWVIFAGFIVEFFCVKFFIKISWQRSLLITFVMNFLSTLIGIIGVPLSGIFIELILHPLGGGTFQTSHWIAAYIAALLFNATIEGTVLKLMFKLEFKRNLRWLIVANAISIFICMFIFDFELTSLRGK